MPAPDLMHPQQCLGANIRRAARAVNAYYDRAMPVAEGQATQFTLLAAINGFGACTPSELAAWLGMDPTTVTRSVGLLTRDGLVTARRGKADRRTRQLELTDDGRARMRALLADWRTAQGEALRRFGPEKARQLLALLGELAAAVDPELAET